MNKIDIYNQPDKNNISATIEDVIFHLKKQIMTVLNYCREDDISSERELEEELGIKIFERNNKGISVSEQESGFLTYAKQAVSQHELSEPFLIFAIRETNYK